MAPVRSWLLPTLLVVALAGCSPATSGGPSPGPSVTVGGSASTATPGSPGPSGPTDGLPWPPAGGATIAPPDLSDEVIDCSTIRGPCDHGDDPRLDRLWDSCAAGDGTACDRLYYDSGFDTRYEQFGNTCGGRDVLVPCPEELP